MKTLQESIIGRKGSQARFTKDMFQSGYIIRFRNISGGGMEFGMYFSYNDISKIRDSATISISHIVSYLSRNGKEGVFITMKTYSNNPSWMPVLEYSKNLDCPDDHRFDIIEVYPIKTKPDFLTNDQLKDLVKDVNPIRIHQ